MKTSRQYYRVDSREISFLRFILEGYDGLAVLTTLDARSGKVVLTVAPGCEQDVSTVIRGLKKEMLIEPLAPSDALGRAAEANDEKKDDPEFLY